MSVSGSDRAPISSSGVRREMTSFSFPVAVEKMLSSSTPPAETDARA